MAEMGSTINIKDAEKKDFCFIINLMKEALEPFYGGDHIAHAKRIFNTHISGGKDNIGHFSFEQKMFILTVNDTPAGMIHLVGKRQGTYKISPIIVVADFRGRQGLGTKLLEFVENYARKKGGRQIYCTVTKENERALKFFVRNGYIIAGQSDSHYKEGITEMMLYKLFLKPDFEEKFDSMNISVQLMDESYESQVRDILLNNIPKHFMGIDMGWIDALFKGYKRLDTKDVNMKYKLIFTAIDREDKVLGVAGATPKKGYPIKVMPFIAKNIPAFVALLTQIPYELKTYGNKLYIHIIPSAEETLALQQRGWKLDTVMPGAYHRKLVTQQWSLDIRRNDFMKPMRTKQIYLDMIKKREKTVEVRVGYKNIREIKRGERINFVSRAKNVVTIIKDIREYSSFKQMIEKENANKIIPRLNKAEVLMSLSPLFGQKTALFKVH